MRFARPAAVVLATAAVLGSAACGYRPGSRGFTDAPHTWPSTAYLPLTLSLIDTRTDEVIWTIDVPPGKWLVTRFVEGGNNLDSEWPDRLEYHVFDEGTKHGRLRSSIVVPDRSVLQWYVDYRTAPEFVDEPWAPEDQDGVGPDATSPTRPLPPGVAPIEPSAPEPTPPAESQSTPPPPIDLQDQPTTPPPAVQPVEPEEPSDDQR